MTENQIRYHTLQENRRHNAAQEAIDKISAEGAKLRGQGSLESAQAAKDVAAKKINENVWSPLKTISDNIAKVLGGIL